MVAAVVILATTKVIEGGMSDTLIQAYVLPLTVSAVSLAVFAGVLFARNKGKIPGFEPEPRKGRAGAQGVA
jgi:hypothetical protein